MLNRANPATGSQVAHSGAVSRRSWVVVVTLCVVVILNVLDCGPVARVKVGLVKTQAAPVGSPDPQDKETVLGSVAPAGTGDTVIW